MPWFNKQRGAAEIGRDYFRAGFMPLVLWHLLCFAKG
jgi:hypothetical protein